MDNYAYHTRKLEKKTFKRPFIIYKNTSDDALIYCLKIIQYLFDLEFIEKIYVEDVELINTGFRTDREELSFIKNTNIENSKKISHFELSKSDSDICIVIGGDGTILWANHIFKNQTRPPFLAFNLGTLGYMATYCCQNYKSILDDVFDFKTNIYYEKRTFLKGKFLLKNQKRESSISKLDLNTELKRQSSAISAQAMQNILQVNTNNEAISKQNYYDLENKLKHLDIEKENFEITYNSINIETIEKNEVKLNLKELNKRESENMNSYFDLNDFNEDKIIYALNDITIERKNLTHMINTEIYYNDEPLTIIKSNGIIIATPTGSTAYSLSAGGTIMHYGLDCFILNSVCAFSLSFRPIAFPRGEKLKIILTPESNEGVVINDGINNYDISYGQGIEVELSDKFVEFILIEKFYKKKSMLWKQKIIHQLGWNNSFKNVGFSELEEN